MARLTRDLNYAIQWWEDNMTVKELITDLQKLDENSRVFMGYDGNVVVAEAYSVISVAFEKEIGSCWWRVKIGDTVILCDE